jgi:hypothetical protein
MAGYKGRNLEVLIVTAFLVGVMLPPSTEGFFSYNPFRRAASIFDGLDIWSEAEQG